ncbi:MAG TPA: hypothetical protein ENG87_05920 [Candidatus Pacearchaeota archaeon]|nr:hypothetical protein [Candidatus Pacearchaeota archaeon]
MEYYKKVAENNVEIHVDKEIKDVNGNSVLILEYKESYGQDRINKEMILANDELDNAVNFNVVQYKSDLVDKLTVTINKLTSALALFDTETIIDVNGNQVKIYNQKMVDDFRELGVSQEALNQTKQDLSDAQNLDEIEYKQNLINTAQNKIDRLNLIQTEMEKII